MATRPVSLDGEADILLDRALLLVGRHPRCDARLSSFRVSRLHCCLSPHHSEIFVRDLVSTNGTRINGHPAETGLIRAGDELSIAHFRYRLEADSPPESSPISRRRSFEDWH
jgi:pSer/pThr/pTyr-binding forkhead associated (FHA) protein